MGHEFLVCKEIHSGNNIPRGSLQIPCLSKTTVDRIKVTIYQMLMIEILTFNEREHVVP